MTVLAVAIPDATGARLRELAAETGLAVGVLVRGLIEAGLEVRDHRLDELPTLPVGDPDKP